ncbi:MAG: peptidylprolyl isomerase [Fluviicola sp.]
MKLLTCVLFLVGVTFSTSAQTEEEIRSALNKVHSLDDLESLKKEHPDWTIFSRTILSLGSTYDSTLFHAKKDTVIRTQAHANSPAIFHKIVEKGTEEACKVQYIFLDGKRRSTDELRALRERIIAAYKEGTPFLDLVRKFSEDGNPTGTLDWFYEGMMDPDFDKAVRDNPSGTIFTVDIPLRYWYYVVLKTEENRELPATYTVSIRTS